ncbi:hypothetical protein BDV96DRAFT_646677 [Lophiotrema nucula]|uniref:Uncharacterized protein n=1 Tax=Lophiotrema nucula TaxID=690887 RepID=A0A6A5Z5R0_9PLEO|nr:hypothetical protein BDV96DRAFT_646677 [Lophiotrema nucula]
MQDTKNPEPNPVLEEELEHLWVCLYKDNPTEIQKDLEKRIRNNTVLPKVFQLLKKDIDECERFRQKTNKDKRRRYEIDEEPIWGKTLANKIALKEMEEKPKGKERQKKASYELKESYRDWRAKWPDFSTWTDETLAGYDIPLDFQVTINEACEGNFENRVKQYIKLRKDEYSGDLDSVKTQLSSDYCQTYMIHYVDNGAKRLVNIHGKWKKGPKVAKMFLNRFLNEMGDGLGRDEHCFYNPYQHRIRTLAEFTIEGSEYDNKWRPNHEPKYVNCYGTLVEVIHLYHNARWKDLKEHLDKYGNFYSKHINQNFVLYRRVQKFQDNFDSEDDKYTGPLDELGGFLILAAIVMFDTCHKDIKAREAYRT